ncbi:MAG: bifunctional oligoribonuclease/PAP phosphatase NrnA [Candidatus Omnitrophota bacterium]
MMNRAIIQALRKYRKFVVTMHVNPDPDALGSAVAMTLYLKSIGKTVRLMNDGPHPQWLDFMPESGLCEPFQAKDVFKPEVVVVLDCGDKERVGAVAAIMTPGVKVINIDHHVTNTRFGDLNLVQTAKSSTSEILYDLLKAARCKFTRDMAVLLYLGILTDTGSFGFDSTSSHTHRVIADLLKLGFSVSDLYRQVYETLPRTDLKPFLALMNMVTLHADERIACLTISLKQAKRFSSNFDLKDKVFSFLRAVKGLEVIMILAQQDKKITRLNLRSRGVVDVARFASKFNGGGHKKASGGFVKLPLGKAKACVLAAMAKEL